MNAAVPTIYAPQAGGFRLAVAGRLLAAAIALACLAVLVIAARLRPDPAGVSTHTQLGLAPCQFEARTGLPCPTCGMTTSFAHLLHGRPLASLYVQPAGTVLAIVAATTFWAGIYIALSGRPAHRLLRFIPGNYLLISLMCLVVIAWAWKIYIHLRGADGWG